MSPRYSRVIKRLRRRPHDAAITPEAAQSRGTTPESAWFWEHYDGAAGDIATTARECGIELKGRQIADFGCGDGIMALGLCRLVEPSQLVGFDVNLTDSQNLVRRAREENALDGDLPSQLSFRRSEPTAAPADDDAFDFVYSWSAFEHIAEPVGVLREIRRILRPHGSFFLQLWPFYLSARGSHLWDWFPEEFHHLRANHRDIIAEMRRSERHSEQWTAYMSEEYERLNRITLDELQRAVLASGFDVRRLELITLPTILTPELGRYSWADLAVSGIKLVATTSSFSG